MSGGVIGGEAYRFPEPFAVVAAAESVQGMDDPGLVRLVLGQMRDTLAALDPALAGFAVSYHAHPRDQLVEIVGRCYSHVRPRAALAAFRDAVSDLRPDDAGTTVLRAVVGDAR